jgi:hypothetical protein
MFAILAGFLHIQDGWYMERFRFQGLFMARLLKNGGGGKRRTRK